MNDLTPVLLMVSFSVGIVLGVSMMTPMYQDKAIENNCAHYDAKTGAFAWNGEVKP